MTRTDIHRPGSPEFDPEAYELRGVFDLRPEWPGEAQARIACVQAMLADGYSFAGAPHGSGQCDHCGAHLRYVAYTTYRPTMTIITFGEDCLDNRLGETAATFQTLRARAAEAAKRTREANARNETLQRVLAWLGTDGHPMLAELTYRGNGGIVDGSEFLSDIARKLYQYGDLTPKQGDWAVKVIEREMQRNAATDRRAAEEAARKATAAPAPTGRITVTGGIEHTWTKDNGYTLTTKMRVRHADGWIVISTAPAAALAEVASHEELRGRKITFTATLGLATWEPEPDPTVAFAKRPTKVMLS